MTKVKRSWRYWDRHRRERCDCGGYWFPHRRTGGACYYGPRSAVYLSIRAGLTSAEAQSLHGISL